MNKSNSSLTLSTATSSEDEFSEETSGKCLMLEPDVKSVDSDLNSSQQSSLPRRNKLIKETTIDNFSFRRNLELSLRTDLGSILKSEHNFYQKNKPITIPEEILIDECLMVLSGLKPNLVFLINDKNVEFNSKFQLKSLNKELVECLKHVTDYSKIIFKLESFVKNSTNPDAGYTQTYEAFSQCIIEFLKYFKKFLNSIGQILLKKEIKFTLVDFLPKLSKPFFTLLDLLDQFLIQISSDSTKLPHEKTINLLTIIHKYLIDSYSAHRNATITSKFLMWIFVNSIRPLLTIIDAFIEDGSNLDTKHELGFKRVESIQINNPDYWTLGYELIIKKDVNLPNFLRLIITSAFKISKHMEIIKLLGNFNKKGCIYENFLKNIVLICGYLVTSPMPSENEETPVLIEELKGRTTFLDLNEWQFNRKQQKKKKAEHTIGGVQLVSIEHLIEDFLDPNRAERNEDVIGLNLEASIDEVLENFLGQNLEWCSTILIENLLNKFHMIKYFEFIHSYYLYKSNEIMFVFSKKLFEIIKDYELYQESAILNSIFFNSANTVIATTSLMENCPFGFSSITMRYDELAATAVGPLSSKISSRLISKVGMDVDVKWPLNIILKPQDLVAYNRIFLFILQIKQAKFDLDNLNLFEMDLKLFKKQSANPFGQRDIKPVVASSDGQPVDRASLDKMFQIRFKLIVFINNAHDLICNQIYESDEDFFENLKSQRGIDEIIQLHSKFLAKVLKNCLLDNKQFQQIILAVFNLTLQFCDMWRRGITYFTRSVLAKLEELEINIDTYFDLIYRILSSLLNKNQQTHFQPLIESLTIDGAYYKK